MTATTKPAGRGSDGMRVMRAGMAPTLPTPRLTPRGVVTESDRDGQCRSRRWHPAARARCGGLRARGRARCALRACAGPVLAAISVVSATHRIGPETIALTVAFAGRGGDPAAGVRPRRAADHRTGQGLSPKGDPAPARRRPGSPRGRARHRLRPDHPGSRRRCPGTPTGSRAAPREGRGHQRVAEHPRRGRRSRSGPCEGRSSWSTSGPTPASTASAPSPTSRHGTRHTAPRDWWSSASTPPSSPSSTSCPTSPTPPESSAPLPHRRRQRDQDRRQRDQDVERLPQPVLASRVPDRRRRPAAARPLWRGRIRADRVADPRPAGGRRQQPAAPATHARRRHDADGKSDPSRTWVTSACGTSPRGPPSCATSRRAIASPRRSSATTWRSRANGRSGRRRRPQVRTPACS